MPEGVDNVIVVGASLAGVRAAETLHKDGHVGPLVVIGAEHHTPYDRPPLSKEVLTSTVEPDLSLRAVAAGLDVDLRLGLSATALRAEARELDLSDGTTLRFDGLVVATGCRARTLPGTEDIQRVLTLRTLDDARRLRRLLAEGARRVLVVGGGFIGLEVAASCRSLRCQVTLVEPLDQPLVRILGPEVGLAVADLHRSNGVDVRVGVGVAAVEALGDANAGVSVELTTGERVEADVVVVGIGVIPNTSWLEGSGLRVEDGVLCDETTLAAPGVVAAGDVARWPNPLFGETMRVEHWEHALDMASHAARRLMAGSAPGEPYAPVPWFWSDQYDRKIQFAGRSHPGDRTVVVDGTVGGDRFCVLYGDGERVTGVLGVNMAARVVRYRKAIAEGMAWGDLA